MSGQPRISVCMPSFNQAAFLPATLDSALQQTFQDFEIVLVDDGSTDGTQAIAQAYAEHHPGRVRVLAHEGGGNRGISASTNLALGRARGEWIVILDSDDLWFPDTLESRLQFIDACPQAGLICSHYDLINENGELLRKGAAPDISADCASPALLTHRMIMGCDIGNPTVMFRRSCLNAMEWFDPELINGDWEIWTRLVARHPAAFLPRSTALHRRHEHNVTGHHTMEEELRRRLAVMKALWRKAPATGGALALPRLQALLHLEMCSYQFCLYQRPAAAEAFVRALQLDPTILDRQAAYFTAWLMQRPHAAPARQDFHAWIMDLLKKLLAPPPSGGPGVAG